MRLKFIASKLIYVPSYKKLYEEFPPLHQISILSAIPLMLITEREDPPDIKFEKYSYTCNDYFLGLEIEGIRFSYTLGWDEGKYAINQIKFNPSFKFGWPRLKDGIREILDRTSLVGDENT